MIEHVWVRRDDNIECVRIEFHIRNKSFHRGRGTKPANCSNGLCKLFGTAVGQIVPGGASQNNVAQTEFFCGKRDVFWFLGVGRQRTPRCDLQKRQLRVQTLPNIIKVAVCLR